jgi:hypothetical protein
VRSTFGVFPLRGTVNIPDKIKLPAGARIVRAGLDPGDQMQPALWFIYEIPDNGDVFETERTVLVAATSPRHEMPVITGPHAYLGTWYVGDVTFHLLELFPADMEGVDGS